MGNFEFPCCTGPRVGIKARSVQVNSKNLADFHWTKMLYLFCTSVAIVSILDPDLQNFLGKIRENAQNLLCLHVTVLFM